MARPKELVLVLLLSASALSCFASNCDTGPTSVNPNACYSANGDFFQCCPGQCSSSPQATVACPGVGGSNTLAGTPSLEFIEYATAATQVKIGTALKFRNEVRSLENVTIGYTLGTCFYSVPPQADGSFEGICSYAIHLGADQLTAAGEFTSATVADLELTGGTGIFSGARGRIILTTLSTSSDASANLGDFLYQIYTAAPSPFPQPKTAQYSKTQLLAVEGVPPVLPSTERSSTFEVTEIQKNVAVQTVSTRFRNDIFSTDPSNPVGFTTGTCVYLAGPLSNGAYELVCLYTLHVGPDYIVIYGIFTSKTTSVVAIVGGAGQYEKAKGVVEVSQAGATTEGYSVFKYKVFIN